ncbi:hypothetical protein FRX31_017716 [Thalictrum thalictroides]|uniref:Uncharacterized protein n=1 Tax=Thalictrum thalictroides TaxID=46969 RepID=A0A7J6W665_THATH|nr:hypothetical protein FRX31_017716 [Thalictrum thalictroides]
MERVEGSSNKLKVGCYHAQLDLQCLPQEAMIAWMKFWYLGPLSLVLCSTCLDSFALASYKDLEEVLVVTEEL